MGAVPEAATDAALEMDVQGRALHPQVEMSAPEGETRMDEHSGSAVGE